MPGLRTQLRQEKTVALLYCVRHRPTLSGEEPVAQADSQALTEHLRKRGPLRIDAVKSSISLANESHFGAISVRRDYLRLGFLFDNAILHKRIIRTARISPKRIGHSVIPRSPEDVDGQLMGWLTRAYPLQAGKGA